MDFSAEYKKPIGYDPKNKKFLYIKDLQTEAHRLRSLSFKRKLISLYKYLSRRLKLKNTPKLKLIDSRHNSYDPFGYTGHYDHRTQRITLYITDRHDTDILRSFAHEVIHHWQNERGVLHPEKTDTTIDDNSAKPHYAQINPWLRKREMEAYLFGNILFRDWQDEQRMGPPQNEPFLPQPYD